MYTDNENIMRFFRVNKFLSFLLFRITITDNHIYNTLADIPNVVRYCDSVNIKNWNYFDFIADFNFSLLLYIYTREFAY